MRRPRPQLQTALFAVGLLLSACNDDLAGSSVDQGAGVDTDGGISVPCISGLTTISLSPSSQSVLLDGGPAASIAFTATATFRDGHSEAIEPNLLAWSTSRSDDVPAGDIASGVLRPNSAAGGTVTVSAIDGCGIHGSAMVNFTLRRVVNAPFDLAPWMVAPQTGGPSIVYPSDQTRFPVNVYRTLFQWRSQGFRQFRLKFEGPNSTVEIYTDGANPVCASAGSAAGCWEADETSWSMIAGSNAGQSVTWTVDALDTTTQPATVRRAAGTQGAITIGFSKRAVPGAIFYWSTTSAGVRRAHISAAEPENYLTGKPSTTYQNPADEVKCVACHTVSRDGKYMAAPVSASSGGSVWVLEVTAQPPPRPLVKRIDDTGGHVFATFSPDNATVVVGLKKDGALLMVDRATGTPQGKLPLGGLKGTQPDWSPDNTQLVFSIGTGDGSGGAAIDVIPYLGNRTWGQPTTLVPSGGKTNLFPMFSPDGKWLAYARGDSASHGEKTLQLWTVAGSGGSPVELVNANRVVSNQMGNGMTQNSQPTWAPPGDLYWIAFNSKREYGVAAPAGTQQIWVAAIDPQKLAAGASDPSFPAFRLQFQGLAENNHRAFWTLDVREPVPPVDGGVVDMTPTDLSGGGQCVMSSDQCDPFANRSCCDPTDFCDTFAGSDVYTCNKIIL